MSGKGRPEIDRMAVKISHLDRLLSLTGEIIITAGNMSILQRHLQSRAKGLDKESTELVKNATLTSNRISSDLHHLVMDIRLIPIRDTFLRFRRLVRDLARKKGRRINFEIVGEDTLVDKTVAEKLYEPLAHQIRNAVDHGLEDPLDRKHIGKDPQGQLTLKAFKKEGFTYVSVSDDGRGLDEQRIRQSAVEKGIVTSSVAAGLSRSDCFALIMAPGFSTAKEATEISGRGVGMDVVKATVDELGGEVIIESQPDRGSTFTYKIPQLSAVNITDALIVRVADEYYAVPINNVVATQAFHRNELHTTMETGESVLYLGSIIPLHDLKKLLSGRRLGEEGDIIPVIIIEAKNGRVALKVSEFIRPQKLVLIPLPEVFSVKGVTGTTILGGNQLGMVLDPFEMIGLATGSMRDTTEEDFLSRATVSFDEEPADVSIEETDAGDQGRAVSTGPVETETEARPETPAVDEQLAEEFFLEIRNILTELNEDVFQLEKQPEDLDRVNTIFRHFHSIKGNLIMTGFDALGGFVHQVESILNRVRDKELDIDQEIIDLLLDVVQILEQALDRIGAGGSYAISDADLLDRLDKYKQEEPTIEQADEGPDDGMFQLSLLSQLQLQAKTVQQLNIYQSMIHYKPRFQEPFLVAYLILKRLALLGDVIDTVPRLDRIEKGMVGRSIKVLFATRSDPDEVNRFFDRQLKRYYEVTEYENLLME